MPTPTFDGVAMPSEPLLLFVLGGALLVGGAVVTATTLGVSELVIGLGSVVAPGGVPVPQGALTFDIPVTLAVAVVRARRTA